MLLLYAVVIGLALGLLLGGRVERLGELPVHWAPVALAGLLFQVVLFSDPVASVIGAWGPPLYVASTLAVLAVLLRNMRLPGLALIAVGAALNLAAILANGGLMPASPDAFRALTGRPAVPAQHFSNSFIASPSTPLQALGDVFVLPRPIPGANVFSLGDVLIALGAVVFLVSAMRAGRKVPA